MPSLDMKFNTNREKILKIVKTYAKAVAKNCWIILWRKIIETSLDDFTKHFYKLINYNNKVYKVNKL